MHLRPVYLVAPEPEPPTVPTRRAFLIAGATFAAGLGLGGACGYAAGTTFTAKPTDATSTKPDDQAPKPTKSTGNAELDELRRLAVDAPIEELVGQWLYFVDAFSQSYRKDEVLPKGVARLVQHCVDNPTVGDRKVRALVLRDVIARGEHSLQQLMANQLRELERILR